MFCINRSVSYRTGDESVGYVMLRCCSLSFSIGGRRHPEGGWFSRGEATSRSYYQRWYQDTKAVSGESE